MALTQHRAGFYVMPPFAYLCSSIPHTFSMAEPFKSPKKADNRLNSEFHIYKAAIKLLSL